MENVVVRSLGVSALVFFCLVGLSKKSEAHIHRCRSLEGLSPHRLITLPEEAVIGAAQIAKKKVAIGLWVGPQFVVQIDGKDFPYANATRGYETRRRE